MDKQAIDRLYQIKGTTFRGHDIGFTQLTKTERPEAMGITGSHHPGFCEKKEAICSLDAQ